MDLLKTPSVQSLLDSDLESVGSLQYMDFEELDEVEYALPTSEAPTLAEVLSAEDEGEEKIPFKPVEEPSSCSAVQIDFLQAVSQQIIQAQERSSAGTATALSVGANGKLTVGTAHGHLLTFFEQTLRWVCDSNTDRGAVSCVAYNQDSTRLLAGYARGLICQYDSIQGVVLRRVTLGGEIWGTLRVTWAGMSGLALDTGGSVWLIKFSRPLGVRSARSSCLFSGARGEVVAMAARDARILALATLSRVIIVAGGRAAGVRLAGPPDTLPVLAWSDTDERVLVCGRSKTLQWLAVNVTGSSILLRPVHRVELKSSPLWLGWLGGNLAIFDADENLRLWGDDYDKPLDLSQIEPVYASAFFKGLWTDGRVSRAMCMAGGSALGGACVAEGALALLGRRGVVRVRPRDLLARAQASMCSGRHAQALRLLCSAQGPDAAALANSFIINISERPHLLSNKALADLAIKLCLKFNLGEELWSCLWEQCAGEKVFVEALGEATVRGELYDAPPSPDCSQELIERLADCDPGLVERVVASLPLTSLDPHRSSVFTRDKGLWRGVGAIAAALGGSSGAMKELVGYVEASCGGGPSCRCAGGALLLAAADALGGRGAGGRPLPDHARPSARHDALHTLLAETERGGRSPLHVLCAHDARACVRLLEQSAREPPFAGPLGKQNRLRVARALLAVAHLLQVPDDRVEILEFVTGQLSTGALPGDREVVSGAKELAACTAGERSDRAWLALLLRAPATPAVSLPGAPAVAVAAPPPPPPRPQLAAHRAAAAAATRPRVLWRLDVLLDNHAEALPRFFEIENPSTADVDELFEYLASRTEADCVGAKKQMEDYLSKLIELRPRATAALVTDQFSDILSTTLRTVASDCALEFADCLLEAGRLRGEAAAAHFRNLCARRPATASAFLEKNPGMLRPEEALAIVRETGAREAEPACLEATGDPGAALDALLNLVSDAEGETETGLLRRACELCTRVTPGVPAETAGGMWARLLKRAESMPPALLLEAAAYLPPEQLAARVCSAPRVAQAALVAASGQLGAWECAARVAAREVHEALALALATARRGVAVRGRCTRCGRALGAADGACRTTHCARACHMSCDAGGACHACGARVPDAVVSVPPPRAPVPSAPASQDHSLQLVAPPRPDLEGIV
ncbi:vacuolar protein sorting-associated protein 8 homolog [Cydia strobilella]|uniref:vacuolar protein sorting-associated protein 8 homolog n=1 Tax=Cydia strobilella TaxID=1100964 RepID=UPI003003DD7C